MSIELVHVYRGNLVESIHRGDVVAVKDKEILFSYGDPYKETFWRSSAKPFQVIPFIEAGGIEKYNLNTQELALMTSSHGGEEEHTATVISIFKKMKVSTSLLDCGTSRPMFEGYYKEMLQENIPFTALNNPCSGKHSSMIGLGLIKNLDLTNYIQVNHIIQQMMLDTISNYTEVSKDQIHIAIDGCGVPVFGLPIYNMALAYEKLGSDDPTITRIRNAMISEPFYVAGTNRLDTILMEETKGKILAKLGAESVYCMTIINKGVAIAMKIEDGAYRALDSFVPELLLKYEYITEREFVQIQNRLKLEILNHRNETVGVYKALI